MKEAAIANERRIDNDYFYGKLDIGRVLFPTWS